MLQNVVAVAQPGIAPFELGVVCEVFGMDRSDAGLPTFDFAVISEEPGSVTSSTGFDITTRFGLDRAASADLICVPAAGRERMASPQLLDTLREAVDRGARVMSVCTGAFTLGAAGLLDGRPCTTHWYHAAELAACYPKAQVLCDVLYVDDDPVITSAGTAAGIDTCLHLVRKEYGPSVANGIARRMVVAPHREGGQAQYIDTPVPDFDCDSLGPLLEWMVEHLDEDIAVDALAARVSMSPRTFARRFKAETGTTPHAWLVQQRLLHVERLLEQTDEPIERIAAMSGFASSALLRHHFAKRRGITPATFRRTFSRSA